MKVWLITIGEPLPVVDNNPRLMRTGLLASSLVSEGHEVIWWTSTFDHSNKNQRFKSDKEIEINNNYKMIFLHGRSYKNNISLDRIINHQKIAAKFEKVASNYKTEPDIIVCSLPTLELSSKSVQYGIKRQIPVVLDIRDLWPDVFLDQVPALFRSIVKLLLMPMQNMVSRACRNATAIVGNSPAFVEWGVNNAERGKSKFDRVFPFGYSEIQPENKEMEKAFSFWEKRGIRKDDGVFTICFFGAVGRFFDLDTVITAARRVDNRQFRFVFCGSGDRYDEYKDITCDQNNIDFPGWLDRPQILALMKMSSLGLAPYINGTGFTGNLPNKPLEYFSAGLPVLSSVRGYLEEVLADNECGVTYDNGDISGLVDILESLRTNPEYLLELSRNAYSTYHKHFRAEIIYPEMVNYLESIVKVSI
jgi:glycosyltransferase involved in cell wall biosynthesis